MSEDKWVWDDDAKHPDGFIRLMKESIKKVRDEPRQQSMRIVSYERYAMAQKCIDDGGTPREIELCLAGAKWPEEVKRYLLEHP